MLFRSDRKSTRLNSSHTLISYAVFCLKKKIRDPMELAREQASCGQRHGATAGSSSLLSQSSVMPDRGLFPCAACCFCFSFFFNDTATTEIYTLSLHDALPI